MKPEKYNFVPGTLHTGQTALADALEDASPLIAPGLLAGETVSVARMLLGCYLRVESADQGPLWLRIVETEAYTADDPACHAYGRTGGRAKTLYAKPGLAYVYLIYGIYHCLNVVTAPEGVAGAVLFRALEPVCPSPGSDMKQATLKTHGPGRLCQALNITKAHNELDMTRPESPLQLRQGPPVPEAAVVRTTRIGIRQAQDFPWRFYIEGNPWVSVREKRKPANGAIGRN